MLISKIVLLFGLGFQAAMAYPVLDSENIKIRKTETVEKDRRTVQWFSGSSLLMQQEFNSTGELLSEKSDLNDDGHFDQHKIFERVEKKSIQTDFDLLSRQKKSEITLQDHGKKQLKRTIIEFNSKAEKTGDSTIVLNRAEMLSNQQGLCDAQGNSLIFQKITALKPLISKLTITSENEKFLITNFGAHIEKKCVEKWGDDFPALVQQSLKENLNCLALLQGKGSELNIAKVASILGNKEKPWKVICSESLESGALASIPGVDADHPWVKLNADSGGIPPAGLKYTVFHELLHNCGHTHDVGSVEYMYACPRCCDNGKDVTACRICKGNYSSAQDPNYLVDYAKLGFIPGQGARLLSELLAMSPEKRNENWALYLKHVSMMDLEGAEELYGQIYQAVEQSPGIKKIDNLELKKPKKSVMATAEGKNLIEALRQIDKPAIALSALEKNLKSMKENMNQDAVSYHSLTLIQHIEGRLDGAKKEDAELLKRIKNAKKFLGLDIEE